MIRSAAIATAALLLALAAGAAGQRPPGAQVIVLSNSSPHLSVIDTRTHEVVRTADVPQMTTWGWNDDNNAYDGKHLWLGLRNPDTSDVEVILLDLDTLQVSRRIPLGQDRITLYIGKPSRHGVIYVSKHASGELVSINTSTSAVETMKLPVNDGVACDVDVVTTGPGVRERAFVPTDNGNTVLSVDTASRQVVGTASFVGSRPFMLTASPDGSQVWVQERAGNSVTVLNARTLEVVKRIPTAQTPIIGTFSPDGKVHYTGHAADTAVIAHDTSTFRELWRARVGSTTDRVGVHPSGAFIYATASREGLVGVIEARTGRVLMRVPLGTNPSGLFVRRLP
jgi:YVTN family beta-propeller protein